MYFFTLFRTRQRSGRGGRVSSTRNPIQRRILVALAATLIAAVGGTLLGYLAGRMVAIRLAETWMDQYASRILNMGEAASKESLAILAQIQASPYPACSDAEIVWLRELVFRTEYLKDAGRIRDGRIDCSATEGRSNGAAEQFTPDPPLTVGVFTYRNLLPFQDKSLRRVGLQVGNNYVIFGQHIPARIGPIPMNDSINDKDSSNRRHNHLAGTAPDVEDAILIHDVVTQVRGVLYVTRCSDKTSSCVTAYTPVQAALQGESRKVLGGTLSGTFCGALFGLLFSLAYRRSQSIDQQLRRAVRNDQLRVFYQPIVDLDSERIVGAEALARWNDEDGSPVSPDIFIKIAEQHGFVSEITHLVLRHVLHDFGETMRTCPDFRMNINIAAADLSDPEFLPRLERLLKEANVEPRSLAIELTESSTARHEVAQETIFLLRQRGHHVHIDDFGTGYSSLAYLNELAVDAIKIDRAFTKAIGTNAVTVGILPQILAMAEALNLQVIVEGVETQEQARYFSHGDRPMLGQGWLYGRPIPATEFYTLLNDDEEESAFPLVG